VLLIDESYNANPASMRAALALLGQVPTRGMGRRIAVLGDMLELGPEVAALHAGLADAGLTAEDIGYVNAHGTATAEGDPIEIAALKAVFGERAATLPVSATKSMHGHLLGAAGAIEAIATVLALREDVLPPTGNLADNLDPACVGVDHLTVARGGSAPRAALSNSFAFGGSNAVLVFRSVHKAQ